ncbi:MAG: transcription-repair coupling factor [Desulfobulbus propionicus]|nr:MAG: transcription-repair coupling factor [Desulfobulbus propionicus]
MQSILSRFGEISSVHQDIAGLNTSASALFLARMMEKRRQSICCILPSDEQLEVFAYDFGLFSSARVLLYPSLETPPYTPLSPDPKTVAGRLSTLYQVSESGQPCIIFASAEAVLRRLLPKDILFHNCELLLSGEEIDRENLVVDLICRGYQLCEMVRQEGDLTVRGGIIDLYPPAWDSGGLGPVRLDFFGDTIESIRLFNPFTQRSGDEIEEAVLLPVSDILFTRKEAEPLWEKHLYPAAEMQGWSEKQVQQLKVDLHQHHRFPGIDLLAPLFYGAERLQSFFDYLPEKTSIVVFDPFAVNQKFALVLDRAEANYREAVAGASPVFMPNNLFLDRGQVEAILDKKTLARLISLPDPDTPGEPCVIQTGDHSLLCQEIEMQRKKRGLLAPLADRIKKWQEKKEVTVIACRSERQANHLAEIFNNYQLKVKPLQAPLYPENLTDTHCIYLVDHSLSKGFDLNLEKLHVLSANELFGDKRLQKKRRSQAAPKGEPVQLDQLHSGDVVVHREHGVGVFQELVNIDIAGHRGDFMLITYRNDDKLYVPVDKLHWVSRYQGLSDQQPRLDSLGSQKWQATKKKVTEEVWKVARELLEIYARRALRKGHRFSPPGELYRELEESFPFDETPGQAKAIDDTLGDLTSARPMDRLVCGDVGYGKTEVAARAAFKVIEDGFQVALLVPTTVLAEQHAATFRDRFSSFPVETACLNRFRSAKEQREIRKKVSEGSIDLVVGTHRLLSRDITFNRLGLLIIDEEHRFGVSHKEKIKKLKAEVDVLTLTATPIPRTLQMSLLGIRDLSVISTPPQRRRSVKTFLAKNDQLVIREAVLRELHRGGQLFFVHNRVRTINRIAENIASLVPHARVGIAHGQMTGQQLEEVMVRFVNHEIDILVCTTIVESGLDIPNANTILINRADHLGLADIYQLRGRVGRSPRQAYAYLFVPSLDQLSGDAKKRLRAIIDNADLGAGFKLAMNDLQIRGGGNLLGVSQSGHIAAVGYDLYLELLQATVSDLKQKALADEKEQRMPVVDPEVKVQLSAYIPDDYIADTGQRYQAYRRISALSSATAAELDDMREELRERYGQLPRETKNLLQIIALKMRLRTFGINKLEQAPASMVFTFGEQSPIDIETLLSLVQGKTRRNKRGEEMRLTPDNRLIVPLIGGQDIFSQADVVLDKLRLEESE